MNYFFLLLFIFLINCSGSQKSDTNSKQNIQADKSQKSGNLKRYYPAGETEEILDENGNIVSITDDDFEYFKNPSKDPLETFRVLITGTKYIVRQIRYSKYLKRKPDSGGDALIIEDISKYDGKINFLDDGVIVAKLHPKSGKLENVNNGNRLPRISDLSKVIQNDSTRWQIEHLSPEPTIIKYMVTYYMKLEGTASKDEIKEQLKKEVKK
jgi:hypothetical protein